MTASLHRAGQSSLLKKVAEPFPFYRGKPLQGTSVVVAGAGPAGLRFAIEARLVGADVHVLEKRASTLVVAEEMKQRMLAIPLTGNEVNFNTAAYDKEISGFYGSLVLGNVPHFF
ncbi:unnamed protein product [Polarella glacialis]|uniref:FAD/NAD(P)-binding domain-containing protein n=1 Tax=Polarella glacialis TaxID=89957 RepID=A0A813LCF2_POLGL|nr:unnamed protein product [Polarella glacialis]